MEDTKIIQKIIDESSDPENGINGDDEEKFTAEEISDKIQLCGELITNVSIILIF